MRCLAPRREHDTHIRIRLRPPSIFKNDAKFCYHTRPERSFKPQKISSHTAFCAPTPRYCGRVRRRDGDILDIGDDTIRRGRAVAFCRCCTTIAYTRRQSAQAPRQFLIHACHDMLLIRQSKNIATIPRLNRPLTLADFRRAILASTTPAVINQESWPLIRRV